MRWRSLNIAFGSGIIQARTENIETNTRNPKNKLKQNITIDDASCIKSTIIPFKLHSVIKKQDQTYEK